VLSNGTGEDSLSKRGRKTSMNAETMLKIFIVAALPYVFLESSFSIEEFLLYVAWLVGGAAIGVVVCWAGFSFHEVANKKDQQNQE
jgi:multisubunit Na+/H+ antiporter MnhE subunit